MGAPAGEGQGALADDIVIQPGGVCLAGGCADGDGAAANLNQLGSIVAGVVGVEVGVASGSDAEEGILIHRDAAAKLATVVEDDGAAFGNGVACIGGTTALHIGTAFLHNDVAHIQHAIGCRAIGALVDVEGVQVIERVAVAGVGIPADTQRAFTCDRAQLHAGGHDDLTTVDGGGAGYFHAGVDGDGACAGVVQVAHRGRAAGGFNHIIAGGVQEVGLTHAHVLCHGHSAASGGICEGGDGGLAQGIGAGAEGVAVPHVCIGGAVPDDRAALVVDDELEVAGIIRAEAYIIPVDAGVAQAVQHAGPVAGGKGVGAGGQVAGIGKGDGLRGAIGQSYAAQVQRSGVAAQCQGINGELAACQGQLAGEAGRAAAGAVVDAEYLIRREGVIKTRECGAGGQGHIAQHGGGAAGKVQRAGVHGDIAHADSAGEVLLTCAGFHEIQALCKGICPVAECTGKGVAGAGIGVDGERALAGGGRVVCAGYDSIAGRSRQYIAILIAVEALDGGVVCIDGQGGPAVCALAREGDIGVLGCLVVGQLNVGAVGVAAVFRGAVQDDVPRVVILTLQNHAGGCAAAVFVLVGAGVPLEGAAAGQGVNGPVAGAGVFFQDEVGILCQSQVGNVAGHAAGCAIGVQPGITGKLQGAGDVDTLAGIQRQLRGIHVEQGASAADVGAGYREAAFALQVESGTCTQHNITTDAGDVVCRGTGLQHRGGACIGAHGDALGGQEGILEQVVGAQVQGGATGHVHSAVDAGGFLVPQGQLAAIQVEIRVGVGSGKHQVALTRLADAGYHHGSGGIQGFAGGYLVNQLAAPYGVQRAAGPGAVDDGAARAGDIAAQGDAVAGYIQRATLGQGDIAGQFHVAASGQGDVACALAVAVALHGDVAGVLVVTGQFEGAALVALGINQQVVGIAQLALQGHSGTIDDAEAVGFAIGHGDIAGVGKAGGSTQGEFLVAAGGDFLGIRQVIQHQDTIGIGGDVADFAGGGEHQGVAVAQLHRGVAQCAGPCIEDNACAGEGDAAAEIVVGVGQGHGAGGAGICAQHQGGVITRELEVHHKLTAAAAQLVLAIDGAQCGICGAVGHGLANLCTDEEAGVLAQVQLLGDVVGKCQGAGGAGVDEGKDIGALCEFMRGNPALLADEPAIARYIAQAGIGGGYHAAGNDFLCAGELGVIASQGQGAAGGTGLDGESTVAADLAGQGGVGRGAFAVFHQHVAGERNVAMQPVEGLVLVCIFQLLGAFHVFIAVLHAFAHDEGAAICHGDIAGESGMAAQLEGALGCHVHIHGGIGIVPVVRDDDSVLTFTGQGAHAVNGVRAGEDDLAVGDRQAAVGIVGQVGVDAVQRPGAAAGIFNAERGICRVLEGTQEALLAAFLVGEGGGGAGLGVGNHGLIREGIDAEAGCLHVSIGAVPIHAVAVHIQGGAAAAEGEVALNLGDIVDDHRGAAAGYHIVGGIAVPLLQVGGAAAANCQQGVGITCAVYI